MATAKQLRVLRQGHVPYEINELRVNAGRMSRVRGTEFNNPVFEAFLIHCRVLLDFFYPMEEVQATYEDDGHLRTPARLRRSNDIYAFQFISGAEETWNEIAPRDGAKALRP
jgi:hypothetical protein